MNPFQLGPGFRRGRNSGSNPHVPIGKANLRKRITRSRIHRSARLKDSYGAIKTKEKLQFSLLNVDGLNETSFADVKDVLSRKQPDLCVLLETKHRLEDDCLCLDVPGYDVTEYCRSDLAGDKGGGGIAIFTRKTDGLVFNDFDPDLEDPSQAFVRNERAWKTVKTSRQKTAVCSVYAGFQAADDRHGNWNETLFSVLRGEVSALRQDGYRVIMLGDFNGHVGDTKEAGIEGNHPDVNRNGRRFINFLQESNCVHINGFPDLTTGLWTRQRGGVSSVIDYAVIALEHKAAVRSLFIDDQGQYGGGSDHNWLFLDIEDSIVRKCRISNSPKRKDKWNITENQDWTYFEDTLNPLVDGIDRSLNDESLTNKAAEILVQSGVENIGLRSKFSKTSMKSTALPPHLVDELKIKRQLEKLWKSKCSMYSSLPVAQQTDALHQSMVEAERLFQEQQSKVESVFSALRRADRSKILEKCSGNSQEARKYFWSFVNKNVHKSCEIDAVISADGVLHCSPEAINLQVKQHLVTVFNGSLDPIPVAQPSDDHSYASVAHPAQATSDPSGDHSYSSSASPCLPGSDGSGSIQTDPDGWIDRDLTLDDVTRSVKKLKCGKAVGVDNIPNEFIINVGACGVMEVFFIGEMKLI